VRIRFTPAGRLQFLTAVAYIRQDDPSAALRFRKRAEQALRRVGRFPLSGRVIPDFPDLPYREVLVGSYRLFFRTSKGSLWVVGVWHGAQIPRPPKV